MYSFKQFLVELYNVKKFYGAHSIKSIFKSLKWKQMGNDGAFASVWQPPNANYVVKCWTMDSSYEEFLKYITKPENRENPHFPRVLGRLKSIPAIHKRSQKNDMVKMVKLEKLVPISEEYATFVEPLLKSYPYYDYHADDDIFPQAASLRATLQQLEKNRKFGEEDLHMGNLMERPSDGKIVITDPWYNDDERNDLIDKGFDDKTNPLYNKPRYLEKDPEDDVFYYDDEEAA